jgi:hypothetical protein
MVAPWLAVLQHVPWSEVISNAPKLAEGARKLWNTVSGQPPAPVPTAPPDSTLPATPAELIGALEARIAALEAGTAGLQAQMRESTELIKSLADQNTQLIQRAEANRRRTVWLAVLAVLATVLAVVGLVAPLAGGST